MFGEQFKIGVNALIKREYENNRNSFNHSQLYQEILHHAKHSQSLTSKIAHEYKEFSIIENYILDVSNRSPFVLTGASGCGKSTLMAFVAKKVIF
jgi:ABC-type lipoprotein export system ATPase subunit